MSEVIKPCGMCGHHHPADITCQSAKELAESMRTRHAPEPLRFNGSNPLVALAVAEGWEFPEGDPDMLAALHQTTGIPFMHGYILRAYDEGVLDGLPNPLDVMSPREVMRLYKLAWDRYGMIQTKEDAPVPVNAKPRDANNVVYMGKGEGEEFMIGDTTYKPEDAPAWRFTKQPVTVDAYRLPLAGEACPASFESWCDAVGFDEFSSDRDEGLIIHTLEGDMRADPGDWIIKGVKGEFYPCKHDIFIATYKPEAQPAALTVAAAPQDGSKVQGYRKLGDDDIAQMNVFKDESRSFVQEIDVYRDYLKAQLNGPAMLSADQAERLNNALRWLAIARTDVQTACMAACRAVAQPENDC